MIYHFYAIFQRKIELDLFSIIISIVLTKSKIALKYKLHVLYSGPSKMSKGAVRLGSYSHSFGFDHWTFRYD